MGQPDQFKAAVRVIVALALLAGGSAALAAKPGAPSELRAGAVASPDRYGALAASEVLKAGGNAADAAVATAFALAVTLPEAGNLGGGGLMTLFMHGKPYFLDYRETAPAKAGADMYLDAHGDPVPNLSTVGNLSTGVPGTVRGLHELHQRFAALSWQRDLAPAIRFARDGFVVPPGLIHEVEDNKGPLLRTTNFMHYFGGMRTGKKFRQPELAATLMRIAKGGDQEFYEGRTADLIVAQMQHGSPHGLIERSDLKNYHVRWRQPIVGAWHGFTVVTAPPPSSGGIALLQLLTMKEDAAPLFAGVELNSPQYVHLISEIEKRVFADRAQYLGDTDFVSVPVADLIDPAYLARRAREIDSAKPSVLASVKPGLEDHQTTHFSIIDRWGNAISNTYTLNNSFGSGVVVEGGGFLLNDEMDDFSSKPGVPNMYGVVGAAANAIAPAKRPLSSMTPTILLKDGHVAMVIGTEGGSRIFTWVFEVMVDVYDYHLELPAAVGALRFEHQLLPENTIIFEGSPAPSPALTEALIQRGYRIDNQGWNGDIQAIEVEGGRPIAASDPRGRGVSMTVRP